MLSLQQFPFCSIIKFDRIIMYDRQKGGYLDVF